MTFLWPKNSPNTCATTVCTTRPLAGFLQPEWTVLLSLQAATNWVISVAVAGTAGNGIPTTLDGFTFNLAPNVMVGGVVTTPTPASTGSIDWACTSATNVIATARNLGNRTVAAAATAMPAKYMPSECR